MQFRKLDPLANAGPYQRLTKNPIKSFALSEAQYDRIKVERPELVVSEGENAVIGFPYRDFLEVHYSFTDLEAFNASFMELFDRCAYASSRAEAPRGVILPFRDRVNRSWAEKVFWSVMLSEGPEWVEMNLVAPEQPEPADTLEGGYSLRAAGEADREAIAAIETAALELPALSESGMRGLLANATTVRLLLDASGAPVGYVSLRGIGGGWGVIDEMTLRPDLRAALVAPLLQWCVAWLRNHGARRIRHRSLLGDDVLLPALRNAGFAPGETGIVYSRPVERADVEALIDERKASGTVIKFGGWR